MSQHRDFAKAAAVETSPRDGVGAFIDSVDEGDFVFTYRFESKLKGYRDWRWNVVIYAPEDQQPTVSEVLLMPSETSLIAPDWVPWSERLADYRALQAELEAQAALDAEDSEEDADEDGVESEEIDEAIVEGDIESAEGDTSEAAVTEGDQELAISDADQTNEAESDANSTGKRPKRLFGWRKPRVGKKNKK